MARFMALDYGTRRTGIAVSDPLQIIAQGLDTVPTDTLWEYLKTYFAQESVEVLVIGQVQRRDGSATTFEADIQQLIEKLKKAYPALEITRWDETFTSKLAEQSIRQSVSKKKKRRDKGLIDRVSATIILQEYMESKRPF